LYRHVRNLIDVENMYAALALAREDHGAVADFWLAGGSRIALPLFEGAATSGDPATAAQLLAGAFAGTAIERVLTQPDGDMADLEPVVLGALIEDMRRQARTAPLSAAPLLHYALRLRAEVLNLRWIVWGRSLGVPSNVLRDGLVGTP
jgi:vacuolar-type H+-ATPase subunit C/Vma6